MTIPLEQPGLLDLWEHRVECNLGINETLPLSLNELMENDHDRIQELLDLKLGFPQPMALMNCGKGSLRFIPMLPRRIS